VSSPPEDPSGSIAPGAILANKYRIDRVLGAGGMATVFAATHLRLREPVAIKVLHRRILGHRGAFARFVREARVAMRLRSEHVARVYDIATADDGAPFIVMELLRGADLATLLHERGPFPVAEAVDGLLEACQALAEAHVAGVVHRDLKPANLFLCEAVDGLPSVKVLDFGVSKLISDEPEPADLLANTSPSSSDAEPEVSLEEPVAAKPDGVTLTAAFLGSPLYMAPEQIRSARDVDLRADIWALGVILYELVSGRRPFEAASLPELCQRILEQPAPALALSPDGPTAPFEAALRPCFAKDPQARYPSVRAFAEAFAPFGSARARESLERVVRISDPRAATRTTGPQLPLAIAPTLRSDTASGAARSSDGERPSHVAPPSRLRALRAAGMLAGLAGLAATFWLSARHAPAPAAVGLDAAGQGRCVSARACTAAGGGVPARCREDGMCAPLASEDCQVHADGEALASDDTVWIGTLLPLKNPAWGTASLQAIDLARQDFEQMMSGFSRSHGDAHVRPLGVLACDDTDNAMRAARHLVEGVKVPAVIGFRSAAEVIDVGSALLVPNRVLGIATLTTSPLATSLPVPPGEPRLVWRTTYSSALTARALGRVIPDLLEPMLRPLHDAAPLRVALVRMKSRGGAAFDEHLFGALRFNGKPVLENGRSYREVVFDESDPAKLDPQIEDVTRTLAEFAPDAIIFIADTQAPVIDALEKRWRSGARRPYYLFMTTLQPPVLDWLGRVAERRRRFFGLSPVWTTPVNARFVLHYNENAKPKVTTAFSPSESYDAFYLLAYASYALGGAPVTGANLARALPELLPPGKSVDVGPAQIFDAYSALQRGERIDLSGAAGSLDFDLTTGEAPFDQALTCAGLDEQGKATENVESGVVWRSAEDKLVGALRCP
jgi:serine/threonine-protein kinase